MCIILIFYYFIFCYTLMILYNAFNVLNVLYKVFFLQKIFIINFVAFYCNFSFSKMFFLPVKLHFMYKISHLHNIYYKKLLLALLFFISRKSYIF